MPDHPQLSVIIVNHRSDAILGQCVDAINKSSSQISHEIIVVDNPPDSEAKPLSYSEESAIRRIATSDRLGFAAACNLGASKARGEFLLFLNPDVVIDQSAITHLYSALTDRGDAGIAVGRLTDSDGKFQPSCRRFPTLGNLFLSRGSVLHRLKRERKAGYTLPDYPEITSVDSAAAAMMMISKQRFESLSGFDEGYFLYMEDTDLCYRLVRQGLKTMYVPEAMGVHHWGYSTRFYRFRRIIWHHFSLWRFFYIHHRSLPVLSALILLLSVNCLLSLFVELFTFPK